MLNLLRSDIYRLVHRRDFWFFIIVSIAICVLTAGTLAWMASLDFANTVQQEALEQEAEQLSEAERAEIEAEIQADLEEGVALNDKVLPSISYTWSKIFISGGALGVIGSAMVVLFLASDFKGGFVKNLRMNRRGRLSYYGEKLVLTAILQALFLGVYTLATTLSLAFFGFTYEFTDSVPELAIWLLLTWLLECAYAFIIACITWSVRGEWVGIVGAILISTGAIGIVLIAICNQLAAAVPGLQFVARWLLAGCSATLSTGASELLTPGNFALMPWLSSAGEIFLIEIVFIILCMVVVFGVCRKRDI